MMTAMQVFLSGTFGQMIIVCLVVCMLGKRHIKVDYSSAIGMAAIIIAGASSALWGIIVSNQYHHIALGEILLNFFNINAMLRYYLAAFMFLVLDFGYLLFGGHIKIDHWYSPVLLFFKAIIFGGIEEIGWRFTFMPMAEAKIGFIGAVLCSFILWGIWHFLYFYVEGTLHQVQVFPFLLGLFTNCFILSALYKYSGSLWICVMTHAAINTLAQISERGNKYIALLGKAVIILCACSIAMIL